MAQLTALVAALASGAQGTTSGSSAVFGDVTNLSTSVALDSLSLAVASEMVGSTALVASGRAATGEATTWEATETATANGTATAKPLTRRVRA